MELYAATAYQGDDMFFDRQKLADLCRLLRSSVFAEEGAPERAIANVADNVKADFIVAAFSCTGPDARGRGGIRLPAQRTSKPASAGYGRAP